ncbi:MAG TPA: TraR/DksA C4-type zinc finger protein [Acidimicrobiales bacterium]|nr:TraR/DksA C4-type zinc finger protein [Acidimicrobiales bacterium]
MATRQHKTAAQPSAPASTRGRKAAGDTAAARTKAAAGRTEKKTVPASRARKVTKVATPAQPAKASARATARAGTGAKKAPQAAKTASKASATKAAKSIPASKQPAAKAPAKAAATKAAKSAPAGKQPAAKAPAKAAAAPAKPASAKAADKTAARKQPAAKAPASKAAAKAPKKAAAGTAPARAAEAHPAPPAAATGTSGPGLLSRRAKPVERRTEGYTDERWLAHQRHALEAERATYLEQAEALRAEADSLVQEMEPGDIQFDDESGEGGTTTVDRERDLALSAQALQAVEEIDHALAKMASHTYGICENCGRLIPKPRLEALPFARLCIDCKSGGLSRR